MRRGSLLPLWLAFAAGLTPGCKARKESGASVAGFLGASGGPGAKFFVLFSTDDHANVCLTHCDSSLLANLAALRQPLQPTDQQRYCEAAANCATVGSYFKFWRETPIDDPATKAALLGNIFDVGIAAPLVASADTTIQQAWEKIAPQVPAIEAFFAKGERSDFPTAKEAKLIGQLYSLVSAGGSAVDARLRPLTPPPLSKLKPGDYCPVDRCTGGWRDLSKCLSVAPAADGTSAVFQLAPSFPAEPATAAESATLVFPGCAGIGCNGDDKDRSPDLVPSFHQYHLYSDLDPNGFNLETVEGNGYAAAHTRWQYLGDCGTAGAADHAALIRALQARQPDVVTEGVYEVVEPEHGFYRDSCEAEVRLSGLEVRFLYLPTDGQGACRFGSTFTCADPIFPNNCVAKSTADGLVLVLSSKKDPVTLRATVTITAKTPAMAAPKAFTYRWIAN